MAKHPKHGDKDDGDKGYDFDDPQPEVVAEPLPAPDPFVVPNPSEASAPAPTTSEKEPVLEGVKKGDLVRLLAAHYDGYQRFEAGSIVRWWNDTPPVARNAALVETPETPLTAPAMTDGKPPEDYIDPNTGKKPVVGSV